MLMTMLANNPASKWILQSKAPTHQLKTWCNMQGALPKITRPKIAPPLRANTQTPLAAPHVINDMPPVATKLMVSQLQAWKTKTVATDMVQKRSTQLTSGSPHIRFCNSRIISQEAINMLLMDNLQNKTAPFTPAKLTPPPTPLINFEYYAMLMVHLTTGKTISSYKQLMNNLVTANRWQTAFGKDFRSLCQGGKKMGAKGTNAMCMMTPGEVDHMPTARLATYANIVFDYQPQKDDHYRIQITA
jgi:hypothetical protein